MRIHRTQLSGASRIEIFKKGLNHYPKASYPTRTGIFHEIQTEQAILHFNLNGEIIRLAGTGREWPHPQEWLKRTIGNDWVYYSTGGYTGVYETTGEYYLPNLPYATNNHIEGTPFANSTVSNLIDNWPEVLSTLAQDTAGADSAITEVVDTIMTNTTEALTLRGKRLHHLSNGPVSVLPPDTRHVDYQVIPLNISRGCLYKCGFCRVKNGHRFAELSRDRIDSTLDELAEFLGEDRCNFNALFLGEHDALNCGPSIIYDAIKRAQDRLGLNRSYIEGCHTFMFGSVSSLLKHDLQFFTALDELPGLKYINIGLESAHQPTLDRLRKPIPVAEVTAAFDRMLEINDASRSIEITANFVTGPDLDQAHYDTMLTLIRERIRTPRSKGCIYLSPLLFDSPSRARLFDFYKLKRLSRLPLFMYTIQRL